MLEIALKIIPSLLCHMTVVWNILAKYCTYG